MAGEQIAIPASWMRGGTSKALFFLEQDLPPPGRQRDALIKRAMGCPHPFQVDGVGGARGNTSKIAIVGPSEHADADIDYTFAQVGIGEDFIDYRATCGNISAAVGPFAIERGLVAAVEPLTRIRIHNTNVGELLFQDVPVRNGLPLLEGTFVNAGVPGSGAEIFTDFSRVVGTRSGAMLPTGNVRDRLQLDSGPVETTLIDVGNPAAYLRAEALGIVGNESAAALSENPDLLRIICDIRGRAAEAMGLAGYSVRVGLISPSRHYVANDGIEIPAEAMDLCSRFFALDYCAPNYPGSASVSTGAAARIPGSVVHELLSAGSRGNSTVRIGHPGGVMEVLAAATPSTAPGGVSIERLGFGRTARTLMRGVVMVPGDSAAL